ncbi:hypothetical protein Goklo_008629, partial [Gossypium klotzschianum]|nr:hypothetical protein [Gossypium klotzschianum]
VDLVPTVEECTTLLRCPRIQADKAYSRAASIPTILNKLMSITGMSEQWVAARIKQKGDRKCVPWKSLRDLILEHPDTKKRVDVFALSIYGLVIFPKALWHIDKAVSDLFDRLDKRVTPISTILAKTFRFLSACRRGGEGRFIGRNSTIKLNASLNKIEELKGKIEELETALQNCELRVELLETNNEHWKVQLQYSQS